MHAAAFAYVQAESAWLQTAERVLEIGSRNINGTIRPLFPHATHYIGIDIAPGPDVDLVANGATYVPEADCDVVVCCEVLEHTPEAEAIVVNAVLRCLKPGGMCIITCAGPMRKPHSAVDGGAVRDGEYYRNVHPEDFQTWLRPFKHLIDEVRVDLTTRHEDLRVTILRKRSEEC
jgi:SAM-dependent methyltransferase